MSALAAVDPITSFAPLIAANKDRVPYCKEEHDRLRAFHKKMDQGGVSREEFSTMLDEVSDQTKAHGLSVGTWSNYGTAAKHWARFCTRNGMVSEILFVDTSQREERCQIRHLFNRFMAYLILEIRAKEGFGMTTSSTLSSYAGQIISLHQMVDVDLSFLSIDIKRFAHGRAKQLVELRGPRWKRKKNGFTIQQFAEWERLNWSPYAGSADPEGRCLTLRALYQCMFACHWRRSDSTMKKDNWSTHLNLSRASVRWFTLDHRELAPTVENLVWLKSTRQGYARVRSPPGKSDQLGDGSSARFPSLLPLDAPGVIQPGLQLLLLELHYVIPESDRALYPLFTDPDRNWMAMRTDDFDKFIMWLLKESLSRFHGQAWSVQQIKDSYSLHSFRIGATCALRSVGAPKAVRMMAGRWLSEAIDEYNREEVEEMLAYMRRQQSARCQLVNGQPEDMPEYPGARNLAVGEYFQVEDHELPVMQTSGHWSIPTSPLVDEIQRLYDQKEMFQLLVDAQKGVTKAGVPVQRWVQATIVSFNPGDANPIRLQFTQRSRPDELISWTQWATYKLRVKDHRGTWMASKGGMRSDCTV